jgi:thymidylate synthase (FAD)
VETRRPTNLAAEELLGLYFPVLDHGFVALVDYMGSDEDVERAARVSYGYGTRRTSETRGLIRYLRRHRHTTPSEMVELKFHCAMPIFVARQWVRHRAACLAEGTDIYFDLPGGLRRQGRRLYKLKIEDVFRKLQPTRDRTRPDKQGNPFFRADRVRRMKLRQVNEQDLTLRHVELVNVYRSGRKPVFRMTLADGKAIECTADHRFLFSDGWKTLHEATGLDGSRKVATWRPGDHFVYVNGATAEMAALYRDRRWLDEQYNGLGKPIDEIGDLCGVGPETIRKWVRLHGQWREANHLARSGASSNFWRGGTCPERASIGRWTSQRAHLVHLRNRWTCQLCHTRANDLHVHHIVPVWADVARARDDANLTSLCGPCHHRIHGRELEYVEQLGGPPVEASWQKRPRVGWNKLTVARLVRIERFEFVGEKMTYDLEVRGPHHNFIANGIVTHNSVNEYSGRYSLLPLLFYRPAPEHFQPQSATNRQGRSGGSLDAIYADAVERWERARRVAAEQYEWLVHQDVARELARIDLPLSTYTQWYWKIDLHNLVHFLGLRADPHAQYEIRAYARVMAGMLKRVAPLSFEAWLDYEYGGAHLSRGELAALQRLVDVRDRELHSRGDARVTAGDLASLGLSRREADELLAKLSTPPPADDFDLDLAAARPAEHFARMMEAAVPRVDRK